MPMVVLGLEYSVGSLPILSLVDVPAKPAECPAAEASLHMLTLYHQCIGPVLLMWVGRKGQVSGYRPVTYCGAVQVTLGKHLKGSLFSFPRESKLILVIRNL